MSYDLLTLDEPTSSLQNNTFLRTINKPGIYILRKDIMLARSTITIASDNVIIKGNGYRIRQIDTKLKNVFAIVIKPGFKTIQICDLVLENISGGGIWFQGNNSFISVKNVKMIGCGYLGQTKLKRSVLPPEAVLRVPDIPVFSSQGIFLDGNMNYVNITDCNFFESGILREGNTILTEENSGAILCYDSANVNIKGCVIDACAATETCYGITMFSIDDFLIEDCVIVDIFSSGKAKAVFTYDAGGEFKNNTFGREKSYSDRNKWNAMLDHDKIIAETDVTRYLPPSIYKNTVLRTKIFKGVIPKYIENEPLLFEEIKWKEFRTMRRLVAYHPHQKSKLVEFYRKWVEIFCKETLKVKINAVDSFANLYINGNVELPAHRDQFGKWIIGLSFGETRTIEFVPDNPELEITKVQLDPGDVFIFSPDANDSYRHRMLPEPDRKNRRINLTFFIDVIPGEDENLLVNP